ncbi:hypothetical protein HUJ05_003370 [Dendroctonus ponderosae]|nr:hypothetical protein HUJ05_003370 [Dendroctonus ponderosae]
MSVYVPDMSKPEEISTDFYETVLNARVGNGVIDGIKHKYNENVTNRNGKMLTEFCAQNELRMNNTYFSHKEQHKYTFYDNRNNKSTIDYIITNQTFLPQQITDVRTLSSANIGTDHSLVPGKLRMRIQKTTEVEILRTITGYTVNDRETSMAISEKCHTDDIYVKTTHMEEDLLDVHQRCGVTVGIQRHRKCCREIGTEQAVRFLYHDDDDQQP